MVVRIMFQLLAWVQNRYLYSVLQVCIQRSFLGAYLSSIVASICGSEIYAYLAGRLAPAKYD